MHKSDATDTTIDERLLYWQRGHRNTRTNTPPRFMSYLSFWDNVKEETFGRVIAFIVVASKNWMNPMLTSHWIHRKYNKLLDFISYLPLADHKRNVGMAYDLSVGHQYKQSSTSRLLSALTVCPNSYLMNEIFLDNDRQTNEKSVIHLWWHTACDGTDRTDGTSCGTTLATQGVYSLTFVSDLHHNYCVNRTDKQIAKPFTRLRAAHAIDR